jgi:hypothetical protein
MPGLLISRNPEPLHAGLRRQANNKSKCIQMKNQAKFEAQKARAYRKNYRPTTNLYHFLRTVMIVLVEGQSPCGSSHPYLRRKR